MSANPQRLVTAAQMRRMDELTITREKISGERLMEAAGQGCALGMLQSGLPDGPVVILCGIGNNGGDGFVIARHLVKNGRRVCVLLAGDPDKLTGDALKNFDRLPVPVELIGVRDETMSQVSAKIAEAAVIVDALLGTGLERDVAGRFAELVRLANEADVLRVAVDMPSGLSADTGQVLGIAFEAHNTYTFGLPKIGQFLFPGAQLCGQLSVVDIGIPAHVAAEVGGAAELLTEARARQAMTARPKDAHKGTFGHVLVLAGAPGTGGAAMLCTQTALRSGVGLVTALVDDATRAAMTVGLPEAMTQTLSCDDTEAAKIERALAISRDKTGLVIGPGWGVNRDRADLLNALLLKRCDVPICLDADALNLIAEAGLDVLQQRSEKGGVTVLTPHPGEAARLLHATNAAIQADRPGAAWRLAKESGAIVVLKGAHTIVSSSDGRQFVCPFGNPGMSTGGAGDVLAGLLGGLLAYGDDPLEAVLQGVCAHAVAGDIAVGESGQRGLVASDLTWTLGAIWAAWEAGRDALGPAETN